MYDGDDNDIVGEELYVEGKPGTNSDGDSLYSSRNSDSSVYSVENARKDDSKFKGSDEGCNFANSITRYIQVKKRMKPSMQRSSMGMQ